MSLRDASGVWGVAKHPAVQALDIAVVSGSKLAGRFVSSVLPGGQNSSSDQPDSHSRLSWSRRLFSRRSPDCRLVSQSSVSLEDFPSTSSSSTPSAPPPTARNTVEEPVGPPSPPPLKEEQDASSRRRNPAVRRAATEPNVTVYNPNRRRSSLGESFSCSSLLCLLTNVCPLMIRCRWYLTRGSIEKVWFSCGQIV